MAFKIRTADQRVADEKATRTKALAAREARLANATDTITGIIERFPDVRHKPLGGMTAQLTIQESGRANRACISFTADAAYPEDAAQIEALLAHDAMTDLAVGDANRQKIEIIARGRWVKEDWNRGDWIFHAVSIVAR